MTYSIFNRYYNKFSELIDYYTLVYCQGRSKEDKEDFKQELWIKLYNSFREVYEPNRKGGANPVTWAGHTLRLSARKLLYDKGIQQKFEEYNIVYPRNFYELFEELYYYEPKSPEEAIDLSDFVKFLSPKQYEVFLLILEYRYNCKDDKQLSLSSIANLAGINKSTFYEHLTHIRRKFKKYLNSINSLSDNI